ncbi:MAG: 16S rRNA (uracil(1498)-N(3))-methyltransferase [Hyphomicrobiaceae bacterium]
MPEPHDFRSPRLYVEADLGEGARVPLAREQANYLLNVLRLGSGDPVLVFNGRDGEWRARIEVAGKRQAGLAIESQTRPQAGGPDLHYLFAPLKRARLDYMVQKATELGVARLQPVLTRYTVAERVNGGRMRANVIEAAEQCGILRIPEVAPPERLERLIASWDAARRLIFCDEGAPIADPVAALREIEPGPLAVLIGPEGGFAPEEREALIARPFVVRMAMGPRIMRADTAAVAALALVNAVLGDWR